MSSRQKSRSRQKVKIMNFHGWATAVNADLGYGPYFSSRIAYRVRRKKAVNVAVTGEAGEGKSYLATDIARVQEGLTRSGKDRFKISQVVFRYREFLDLVLRLRMGKAIVFDEPTYAMGKRDWFKELNKALVLTIESQRFKVHPLYISVINKALLDKTIRTYLLQFQIVMLDRGHGVAYRLRASQHTEKLYRYTICALEYRMFDSKACSRESCLDCSKLNPVSGHEPCPLFRAQYERKKASIQEDRYEKAREDAAKKEALKLTDRQVEIAVLPVRAKFTDEDGKIDVDLLRIVAEEELGIKIHRNRAYMIRKLLLLHSPDLFEG